MSRSAAIAAKCKDSIHDPCAPGNWRQQVEGCTVKSCPLWDYRPKSRGKVRSLAILPTERTDLVRPVYPKGVYREDIGEVEKAALRRMNGSHRCRNYSGHVRWRLRHELRAMCAGLRTCDLIPLPGSCGVSKGGTARKVHSRAGDAILSHGRAA